MSRQCGGHGQHYRHQGSNHQDQYSAAQFTTSFCRGAVEHTQHVHIKTLSLVHTAVIRMVASSGFARRLCYRLLELLSLLPMVDQYPLGKAKAGARTPRPSLRLLVSRAQSRTGLCGSSPPPTVVGSGDPIQLPYSVGRLEELSTNLLIYVTTTTCSTNARARRTSNASSCSKE
jgi:hypothetical protein